MRRCTLAIAVLGALALGQIGCRSASGPTSVSLLPGQYARAFEETKDLLAARQFTLERVDARAGVITTRPKPTAGLATPWDTEQSSLRQEFEDVMNQQERRVRVVFTEPSEQAAPTPEGTAPGDRREAAGELIARFEVTLLRVSVPGTRVEPSAIRMSTRSQDPELARRGVGGRDRIAIATDDAFASRLARTLEQRMSDEP